MISFWMTKSCIGFSGIKGCSGIRDCQVLKLEDLMETSTSWWLLSVYDSFCFHLVFEIGSQSVILEYSILLYTRMTGMYHFWIIRTSASSNVQVNEGFEDSSRSIPNVNHFLKMQKFMFWLWKKTIFQSNHTNMLKYASSLSIYKLRDFSAR